MGEPSPVPASHSVLVGYLEEPFLIVGRWTMCSRGEEEDIPPDYPPQPGFKGMTWRSMEVKLLSHRAEHGSSGSQP